MTLTKALNADKRFARFVRATRTVSAWLSIGCEIAMKLLVTILMSLGVSVMAWSEETWSVGEARIKGKPVIYKFINEFPDEVTRHRMPWRTAVSWKYDGSGNNGMPPDEINESMIKLEDGLETIEGRGEVYFDVYTGTGNNLKEFVFYISDREQFMSHFDKALSGHPVYPIEINFYKDKEWRDLEKLHSDFEVTTNNRFN